MDRAQPHRSLARLRLRRTAAAGQGEPGRVLAEGREPGGCCPSRRAGSDRCHPFVSVGVTAASAGHMTRVTSPAPLVVTRGTSPPHSEHPTLVSRYAARRASMTRPRRRLFVLAALLSVGSTLLLLGARGGAPAHVLAQAEPEPPPIPVVLVFGPGTDRSQDGWVLITRAPRSRQTGVQIEL